MKCWLWLGWVGILFVAWGLIGFSPALGQVAAIGDKPIDVDFSELAKKMGWYVKKGDKKYLRVGQRVGHDGERLVPIAVIQGLPFPISSLRVAGELETSCNIKIVDVQNQEFIPTEESLIPVYEAFDPVKGQLRTIFYTQAVNVTWVFAKPGLRFITDGIEYVVEKEGATIAFTKEGVQMEGIAKRAPTPEATALMHPVSQDVSKEDASLPTQIPQMEQRLLTELEKGEIKPHFVIPEIRSIGRASQKGRICIVSDGGQLPPAKNPEERLGEGTILDFIGPVEPGAIVNKVKGKFGVILKPDGGFDPNTALFSPGAFWKSIPNLMSEDNKIDGSRGVGFAPGVRIGGLYEGDGNVAIDYIKAGEEILVCPAGTPGSIHRIIGRLKIGSYIFTGEKDVFSPLTFVLTKEGYVYLRGKGTVAFPNGRTLELGSKSVDTLTKRNNGEGKVYILLKNLEITQRGNIVTGWRLEKVNGMIGVGGTRQEAEQNLSPAKLTENGIIFIEQKNPFAGIKIFRFQIDTMTGQIKLDNFTESQLQAKGIKEIRIDGN